MRVKNFLKSDPRKSADSATRLSQVQQLDGSDPESMALLNSIAIEDEEESVRIAAIAKLTSIDTLWRRYQSLSDDSADGAAIQRRLSDLLSDSNIDKNSLGELSDSNEHGAQMLLACHCSLAELRATALAQLHSEDDLVEIVQKARFHETRLQAASRITSSSSIRTALSACKDRDKVVAKMLQQKIDIESAKKSEAERQDAAAKEALVMSEKLARSVWSPQTSPRLGALTARWAGIDSQYTASTQSQFDKHIASIQKIIDEHVEEDKSDDLEDSAAESMAIVPGLQEDDINTAPEAGESAAEAASVPEADTSPSDNPAVAELQEKLKSVTLTGLPEWLAISDANQNEDTKNLIAHCKSIAVLLDPPFEVVKARAGAVEERRKRVNVLLDTNKLMPGLNVQHFQYMVDLREHRAELDDRLGKALQESSDRIKATHRQFSALSAAVKDGKWGPANSMFKRLQKKVNAMEPKERVSLNDKLSRAEKLLDEMADWQDFAARPKLEALCADMENLPSLELKPPALAKKIKTFQSNWKNLGVSRASNELWTRFKTAGDTAYEPCKAYFEKKGQEREEKINAKIKLCEQLEKDTKDIDWESADWKLLQKQIGAAKRTWRDNRVSDRKPDKALEDRFTACISPIDEKLKEQFDANAQVKKELVEKVTQLASGEINQHVINQTKSLQGTWKQVGVMRRKEDQELWEQFNEQCRKIFKVKHDSDKESYKASMGHVFRARDIIKELRKIAKADNTEEQSVQTLVSEFQALAEFPERDKRGLLKDFRGAVDACSRLQENNQKKRIVLEKNEQQRLVKLCEQLERLVELGSSNADTELDDVKNAWDGSDVTVSREILKQIEARRDRALTHISNGTQYDYSENENILRELLIKMEIVAGVDTPEEDKGRRMEFQLKKLQEGMTSSGNTHTEMAELEIEWLSCSPVLESKKENFHSRYLKAIGR